MNWVAAALSADLPDKTSMPSQIDGVEIALWRSASGKVQAWIDRCPHRGMRLSHGFVRGETLACIYHGWRYDTDGACNHIPAHPSLIPPKTIVATSFTTVEADGVIWVAPAGTSDSLGNPPALDALLPLRSLQARRSVNYVVEKLVGAENEVLWFEDIAILPQAIADDHCTLHTLIKLGTDKKTASAKLEALRNELEGTPL